MPRFHHTGEPPPGLVYVPDFLSADEERTLLAEIEPLAFGELLTAGFPALRTGVQYGLAYDDTTKLSHELIPFPPFLASVRERAATLAGCKPDDFLQALVARYTPRAGVGWHQDRPMFGQIVGISLAASCVMRFRQTRHPEHGYETVLEPRSAYVLNGPARSSWQHTVVPVKELRYSVTFRTLRNPARYLEPRAPDHRSGAPRS